MNNILWTHCRLMREQCVINHCQHQFRKWFVSCSDWNNHLNYCQLTVCKYKEIHFISFSYNKRNIDISFKIKMLSLWPSLSLQFSEFQFHKPSVIKMCPKFTFRIIFSCDAGMGVDDDLKNKFAIEPYLIMFDYFWVNYIPFQKHLLGISPSGAETRIYWVN